MDVQNLMIIPVDLQPLVFSYLDEYSLGTCLTVCETFKKTIINNQELKNRLSQFLIKKWGFSLGQAPHKIIQLVGGYKKLGEMNVQEYMLSMTTIGHLLGNAIDPTKLSAPLVRPIFSNQLYCRIKETCVQSNNTTINVMVIFESNNKLFCHYSGNSDLCNYILKGNCVTNFLRSINKDQEKLIQNLLKGEEIETRSGISIIKTRSNKTYKINLA